MGRSAGYAARMSHDVGVVCVRGIGPERGGRERNEDSYLVCREGRVVWLDHDDPVETEAEGEGLLVAVFDGMGGHEAGQEAASMAARTLAQLYRPGLPPDPARAMRRYVLASHRELHWQAREQGPVAMGTTLTAVWMLGGQVAWTHVGDSRLYLYRDGRLEQVSADHTGEEFARRDGMPVEEAGSQLVQCYIFGSRGLGDNSSLRLEPGLDAGQLEVERGDRLLLCTDGVWAPLDEGQLATLLGNALTPQEAAQNCVGRAIARGSTDNLTAMVVDVADWGEISDATEWPEEDDEATYML